VLIIALAVACHGVDIFELVSFVQADGGTDGALGSGSIYGQVIEGDVCFVQLGLSSVPQINIVSNLSGVQNTTHLVSPAGWLLASGRTSMLSFHGFGISGAYLQFADVGSDAVWRVNRTDGTIIQYASTNAIMQATGSNTVALLSPHTVNPFSGEHVFYEGTSDSILTTAGSNNVQVLASRTDLVNAFGNADVSGGMTYDNASNLYWGQYVSGGAYSGLHKRDTNGAFSVVLTKAQIRAVTVTDYPTFGDIFYAPDGRIYFYARMGGEGSILRFDPDNPVATLEMHVSDADMTNSVAVESNVSQMNWYNGALTWHRYQRNGIYIGYRDLVYGSLSVTGETAVTEFSSNVPYTCSAVLTNTGGSVVPLDCTTSATWSIVGDAPPGTTLDGNLLTVGEATNLPATIQAVCALRDATHTNWIEVWIIPEPFFLGVPGLLALLRVCRAAQRE
jgi:hypothetical protein